jgi:hypothetical protein
MASPGVALIQRMLWESMQRAPKAPQLHTGDEGAGHKDAQGAQHLSPSQEETRSTRPSWSARRRGEESVAAVVQRIIRKNLIQG